MKNENIIKKIIIEIAGVEVEVSPDQAINLHKALGELLGLNKEPTVIKEYIPYQPYVWPYPQPLWYSNPTWHGTSSADLGDVEYTFQYCNTTGDVKLNV